MTGSTLKAQRLQEPNKQDAPDSPRQDPAPRDNIKTSCSPTETPCSTTSHYLIKAQSPTFSRLVHFSPPSPLPPLGKQM